MKRTAIRHILNVLFVFILIATGKVNAQTIRAPIDAQVDLIPKILALDKNFNPSYEKKVCNIGIIYNSELKSSSDTKERILWYWSRKEINIKNCISEMVPIDVSKITNIREAFDKNKIKAVYIAPLNGYDIPSLTKICKDKKVRTFTGVDSFFTDDISVLFDLTNYKLQIFINPGSAEEEGIDFSAYLLNIAELIE
jgi:hypothetical protein